VRAIVKERGDVRLVDVPVPELRRPDDVIVEVIVAGICRTDLHVASGAIESADPITLGHELAGRVVACGRAVTRVAVGDLVTCDPVIGGGFLGITLHGAFADRVVLPEANLYGLPATLDPRIGAYVEPVAAALAVTSVGLEGRGVVYGASRFSHLVREVLRPLAVDSIVDPVAPASCDFAIETSGTPRELALLIDALRPRGTLILKSRDPRSTLPLGRLVDKELVVRAVRYGSFERAIAMLVGGEVDVSPILGPSWPLARFAEAFARATGSESHKVFLSIGAPCAA